MHAKSAELRSTYRPFGEHPTPRGIPRAKGLHELTITDDMDNLSRMLASIHNAAVRERRVINDEIFKYSGHMYRRRSMDHMYPPPQTLPTYSDEYVQFLRVCGSAVVGEVYRGLISDGYDVHTHRIAADPSATQSVPSVQPLTLSPTLIHVKW